MVNCKNGKNGWVMRLYLLYPRSNEMLKQFVRFVPARPEALAPIGLLSIKSNSTADIDFIDNKIRNYDNNILLRPVVNLGQI